MPAPQSRYPSSRQDGCESYAGNGTDADVPGCADEMLGDDGDGTAHYHTIGRKLLRRRKPITSPMKYIAAEHRCPQSGRVTDNLAEQAADRRHHDPGEIDHGAEAEIPAKADPVAGFPRQVSRQIADR